MMAMKDGNFDGSCQTTFKWGPNSIGIMKRRNHSLRLLWSLDTHLGAVPRFESSLL